MGNMFAYCWSDCKRNVNIIFAQSARIIKESEKNQKGGGRVQDFEKIYTEYLKEVYRFLLKLSGSSDIAEELTQSTFTKAFENLENFRGTCKISVWLCQIAKHEYYAYYKKKKLLAQEQTEIHYLFAEGPEKEIMDHEEQIRIHEILHTLREPYKEVFTLRVMAELSYRDIGHIFEKSESWARVTCYRAKSMILERIRGEENEM